MKLCSYGPAGAEKAGLIDQQGRLRDLSTHARLDISALSKDALAKLTSIDVSSLPIVSGSPRIGVPYSGMSKFICVGLNYSDHAAEAGMPIPGEPIIFLKALSALSGPNDDVVQPIGSTKLDWEVELGIVIGTKAQYVSEEQALSHVAGYCVVNDVSERAYQMQSTQWDKGKGCDTFGPVGPWLVTADEIDDPQNLSMWLDVNGKRMQTGNTSNMIFGVKQLISYISRYMTLLPGDLIATGTPPGVGMGKKPDPLWLKVGDQVTLGIEKLGQQTQRVIAHHLQC
jgi:2-keto-4-pentenoate hydratase/2-oxohepta-3-ene-1,7-dioic acid hydratase in catechol pathway